MEGTSRFTVHNHGIDPSCRETRSANGGMRGECMVRSIAGTNPARDGHEHFMGCPCPRCVTIRASWTAAPIPLAYHACCGGVVRLTRIGPDTYRSVEVHNAHCKESVS